MANKLVDGKYINKVIVGTNDELMNITDSTTTASTLLTGTIGYAADGSQVTGTCSYNCDTSGDNVTQADVLSGKTFHDLNGNAKSGLMTNNGEYAGTANAVTEGEGAPYNQIAIPTGFYANGSKFTVTGLTAAEIKKDVIYFGVKGTYDPQMPTEHGTADALYRNSKVYQPTSGNLFDQFTVPGYDSYVTITDNAAGGKTYTIAVTAGP